MRLENCVAQVYIETSDWEETGDHVEVVSQRRKLNTKKFKDDFCGSEFLNLMLTDTQINSFAVFQHVWSTFSLNTTWYSVNISDEQTLYRNSI